MEIDLLRLKSKPGENRHRHESLKVARLSRLKQLSCQGKCSYPPRDWVKLGIIEVFDCDVILFSLNVNERSANRSVH